MTNVEKYISGLPLYKREYIKSRISYAERKIIKSAYDELYENILECKKEMLKLLKEKKRQGKIPNKISLQNIVELPSNKPQNTRHYIQYKMGAKSYTSISMRARFDERQKVMKEIAKKK